MKQRKLIPISAILLISLLLSACSALGGQATPDAASLQSTIDAAVTQTVQALAIQLTQTALAQPTATATLEPTATATLEPSPTVVIPTATRTFIPYTPVPTQTATPVNIACKLISTSPVAGAKFNINDEFDAVWVVKNVGVKDWEIGSLDLVYESGQKMQKYADIFDVNKLIKAGEEYTLIVDMNVPANAGTYKATWKLNYAGSAICTLPVSIEAVKP